MINNRNGALLLAGGLLCGAISGCVPLADATLNEHLISWTSAEITGTHEITVTVHGGDPLCETTRVVSSEDGTVLRVAVIRGYPADAPDQCTLIATQEQLVISTTAPASTITVEPMSAAEAGL